MNKNEFYTIFFDLIYHKKKNTFYPENYYLHHYTDLDGLIGIVKNKCIYSTDSRFLNDLSEQTFSQKFILEYLEINYARKNRNKLTESLLAILSDWKMPKTYITSFSKDSDSLSMWRGYGKEKIAFSLGFGKYFLNQTTNTIAHLVNVYYNKNDQEELLKWIFDTIYNYFNINIEIFEDEENFKMFCSDIQNILVFVLPMLKHPKFHEEQEARLIIRPMENLNIKFKSSKRGLIQFVETDLDSDIFPFLIEEIKIGPTSDREYLKDSVYEFLIQSGSSIYDKRIKNSEIPYRE